MAIQVLTVAVVLAVTALYHPGVHGWDNGLARTPPMGWLSWTAFACNTDCKNFPHQCINEQLYKDMVDRLAADGYLAAGYNTVNIDDCWSEMQRDPTTKRLVADKQRFPSGIKALADYAHSKKVFLGIYSDIGTKTCAGYPSVQSDNFDHTEIDAKTYSDWGVDSLKLDMCYGDIPHYNVSYPAMTRALEKQSHKIIYECSWPMTWSLNKMDDHNYKILKDNCHYWRNYNDVNDSWQSVLGIIKYYAQHGHTFAKYHGPGGWFDPDMLVIGMNGLSYEQSKTQMAFWCLWSVPLFMSNDLRDIRPEMKAILLDKHLIAVNQDPLGVMGVMVKEQHASQVWVKKMSPKVTGGANQWVVLYFNYDYLGTPHRMSYALNELIPELSASHKYDVLDVMDGEKKLETIGGHDHLTLMVKISGSVRMVKLVPV